MRCAEQAGELSALAAQKSAQAQLREISRAGDTDLGVGGDQVLLRRADVGAALQQRGGQAGRNVGRNFLRGEALSARHCARRLAQQQDESDFRSVRSAAGAREWSAPRCPPVARPGADPSRVATPPRLARLRQVERLLARFQRSVGNLQLIVQLAQRQVSGGHIADQRGDHGLAVFLRAQKIRTRGFGGAAQLAPEIHFEREQVERRRSEIAILRGQERRGHGRGAVAREAVEFNAAAGAELWKLIGPRNSQTGARVFHARHRVAKIVVLRQRRADQGLQLFVLEELKPFQIGDGGGFLRGERVRRAKLRGRRAVWGADNLGRPCSRKATRARARGGRVFGGMVSIPLRRRRRRVHRKISRSEILPHAPMPESFSTM